MDRNLNEPFNIEWGSGSALFIRLRYFPLPLSFDERFFLYFEDVDLCAKAHEHGLIVRYLPDIMCIHHEHRDSAESFSFLALHLKSMLKFIIKHRGLSAAKCIRSSGPTS